VHHLPVNAGIVQADSLLDNQISLEPMMLKWHALHLTWTVLFTFLLQASFRQTLCLTTKSVLSL
jgi:hypothetical protein